MIVGLVYHDGVEDAIREVNKVTVMYDEQGAHSLQIKGKHFETDIPFGMCKEITIQD